MNSRSLRRLAADHASLHTSGLPPNYLFPPTTSPSDLPSDLTSLDVLLAGPQGTPYSSGLFKLHLDIPPTYPASPPTAHFRTRIWHPNIDEHSGAVCVETLKRDWSSSLRLRDVLVTISCLLIQPNPASALNEDAGRLAVEDWEGFCRRARLMCGVHAGVPEGMAEAVREAQRRGEEEEEEKKKEDEDEEEKRGETEKEKADQEEKRKSDGMLRSSKGKEKAVVPTEDEENDTRTLFTRDTVADAESDPEGDWIPGPPAHMPAVTPSVSGPLRTTAKENVLGIKGLEGLQKDDGDGDGDAMAVDGPPLAGPKSAELSSTVGSFGKHSFSLRVPSTTDLNGAAVEGLLSSSSISPLARNKNNSTKTTATQPSPGLTLTTQDPHTAHPLLTEFSWTWQDAQILYSSSPSSSPATSAAVKKRHATPDFAARAAWEVSRLRRTGGDLRRYNRGDWGPRVGVGRL
ncbi:UBC-like protein [Westerdykella ornata]|uniref:UBC-like protein n=1 Tax=Westerdykella ornata TaxID=318751 RepID=A0A6A6J7N7_WESOR|nr:UBC-like protein [Westerdykella ornata]KAF2272590.1 UBC-like protein [Westerdykella ornata]